MFTLALSISPAYSVSKLSIKPVSIFCVWFSIASACYSYFLHYVQSVIILELIFSILSLCLPRTLCLKVSIRPVFPIGILCFV